MDDQVSQNARVEAQESLRRQQHWSQLTAQEQSQALADLAGFLASRQELANSIAARNVAAIAARQLTSPPIFSPISWGSLSEGEIAERLREIGADDPEQRVHYLDLADQFDRPRRTRGHDREGRDR